MTDFDLKVAEALKGRTELVSRLGDGEFGIYNTYCDFKGLFPLVIFRKRNQNPVLHADNKLYGYSVSYLVVVCSKDREAVDVADEARVAMETAGFMWSSTDTEYNEEFHEFYTIMSFRIGEKV